MQRIESPVNVTHEVAYGEYRRVFNTTYHILNRYGMIRHSSYRYGEITALISEDTSLFDKTRRTIQARIFDAGDYWDVECRVLIAVEDSEVVTIGKYIPRQNWSTVSSDPRLEVRLSNEIRAALSGGALKSKQPLTPKARTPYLPKARPKRGARPAGKARPARPAGKARPSRPAAPVRKASGQPPVKEVTPKQSSREDTEEVAETPARSSTARRPSSSAYERLGVQRLRRGAYAAAASAFEAAISGDDPRFSHYLLAQARFSQGRFQEALASLRRGAKQNPAWAHSDVNLRAFYGPGLKTFGQRLHQLQRSCSQHPELNLLLGYVQAHSKAPQAALQAFDRYEASQGQDALVTRYRALMRQRVDDQNGVEAF